MIKEPTVKSDTSPEVESSKSEENEKKENLEAVKSQDSQGKEAPLVKKIDSKPSSNNNIRFAVFALVVIIAGISSGYFLSSKQNEMGIRQELSSDEITAEEVKKGMVVGIDDEKTFRDNTKGVLRKGGLDGEGSHHLERPGGESQNVYITSSTIDLDKFNDREIQVWGETFTGKKAGWLMDVGRLKVLE